jgi:hypothetical protein
VIYAGTASNEGLFKSTDAGESWSAIGSAVLSGRNIRSVIVDPNDSETVYAGTDGGVFKSTDGGDIWSPAGLSSSRISTLSVDPQDSQTVYAATNGQGVFKSTDGGATWLAINAGLTNLVTSLSRGLWIDPRDSQVLYAGTRGGVFQSSNGGASWAPINDGLGDLNILALAMDPQDPDTLYAGTLRNSVFVLHIPPRAVVQSVMVNDGSAQRSMVTSLTVTFSIVVHLDPGAFELVRQDGSVIQFQVAQTVVGGHSVDTLTFVGAGILGGSLADGHYTLTIHGGLVHDDFGQALDGAGTGVAGSDRVDTFFRLFGDSDGDGHVGLDDLRSLVSTLGKHAGDPGYLWYFDYNGDGAVDLADLAQFLRRFGR